MSPLPAGSFGSGAFGAGPFGGAGAVAVITTPTPKKSTLGDFIPAGSQLVPLTSDPNQVVTVSLNIDGTVRDFTLLLHYNELAGYWLLSIEDSGGNLILSGIPLVTGEIPAGNILGQFAYLGIGSAFILNASSLATQDYPGVATLGTDFVLVWSNTPQATEEISTFLVLLHDAVSHLQKPFKAQS